MENTPTERSWRTDSNSNSLQMSSLQNSCPSSPGPLPCLYHPTVSAESLRPANLPGPLPYSHRPMSSAEDLRPMGGLLTDSHLRINNGDLSRKEEELNERNLEFRNRCLTWKGKLGRMKFYFNPLSSISAAILVWAVIAWSLEDNSSIVYFKEAQRWITEQCTWIYVATQTAWAIFVIVVYFKFGHIKLGQPNDEPEYSNFDYFAMIFTTGLCNGIVYDAVATPIGLYEKTPGNALNYWGKSNKGIQSQNALNIMLFHYGFHAFSVYLIPGLLIAYLAHVKGLPLTTRTCFYPVFGQKIFGRLGDVVDSLSIICIIFGVSTSFMIGSMLLLLALNQLTPSVEVSTINNVIATCVITLVAAISALSGLKLGIRRMSQLCFLSGTLFFGVIVLSDDIWFVLNLIVQSVGYYFQYLLGMSSFTGAFEQKRNLPNQKDSEADWMHLYTVFYWGWWIAWAPLVGIFIARLSKGRYIKDVINYAFFLPILTSFVWLTGMGGLAIDMKHQALKYNLTCNGSQLDVPKWVILLQCNGKNKLFFALINKYEDISVFLHLLAVAIIVLYFATSFDTSALVIDSISSNGEANPPLSQRLFWCVTVGATTIALVFYEGGKGLEQVHAFAVICGLPFTIVLCIFTMALWRLLNEGPGWRYELDVQWEMFYGNINSLSLLKKVVLAVFVPWYFLGDIVIRNHNGIQKRIFIFLKFATPFYLWIILMILNMEYKNVDNIGWVVIAGLIVYSSFLRKNIRERHSIKGNIFEDACLMVFYPLTIIQMHVQKDVVSGEIKNKTQGGGIDNLSHFNNPDPEDAVMDV